jgi:hypothetical protein
MEKTAKLKLHIRRLPWNWTQDHLVHALNGTLTASSAGKGSAAAPSPTTGPSSEPGLTPDKAMNGKVDILQFQKGKAPNKFKACGAIPTWATIHVADVATREKVVSLLDNKSFDPAMPSLLVCVEYSPLQRVSYVDTARGEIEDEFAGAIFEDPAFLQFKAELELIQSKPLEANVESLQKWIDEKINMEKAAAADSSRRGTNLVKALLGNWYEGKALPWQVKEAKGSSSGKERSDERRRGRTESSSSKRGRDRERKRDRDRDRERGKDREGREKSRSKGRGASGGKVHLSRERQLLLEEQEKQRQKKREKKEKKQLKKDEERRKRKEEKRSKRKEKDRSGGDRPSMSSSDIPRPRSSEEGSRRMGEGKDDRREREERKRQVLRQMEKDKGTPTGTGTATSGGGNASSPAASGGAPKNTFSVTKASSSASSSTTSHADPASLDRKPPAAAAPKKILMKRSVPASTESKHDGA